MPERETAIPWPNWKICRHLGKGSFGNVYEIERIMYGHRETSAMKVIRVPETDSVIEDLRAEGCDRTAILRRLEAQKQSVVREYAVMADMKGCSNIVYCDDMSENVHVDGLGWDIYIKMELLTTLPRAIGPTVSEALVLRVARGIGSALAFCERQGMLHRDIKPQNIFVARDGNCKLGDFGTAKAVNRTMEGTRTGTYKYMAPEVYHDRPYGKQADLYSLGMVLYWMLNDRRTPFLPPPPAVPSREEEEAAVMRRFRGERLPPPAHGSEALKALVLKACSYHPEERFSGAEEFLYALSRLPISAPGREPAPEEDDTEATVRVMRADEKYGARHAHKTKSPRTGPRAEGGDWLYKGGEDYERSGSIRREEKSVSEARLKINLDSGGKSTSPMTPDPLSGGGSWKDVGTGTGGTGSGTSGSTGSRLKINMSKSGKSTGSLGGDAHGSASSESAAPKEPTGSRLKIKMKKN